MSANKRGALFAAALVFSSDGTMTMMTDVDAVPATRTQHMSFQTAQGTPSRLAQFDTLLPDCTENKNFKALVTAMPKSGSLSAVTEEAVANYQPPTPQAACNGQKHRQLVILYTAKEIGADSVTIRAGLGKEVVDLVFDIKAE
jgi:hypothetical protein